MKLERKWKSIGDRISKSGLVCRYSFTFPETKVALDSRSISVLSFYAGSYILGHIKRVGWSVNRAKHSFFPLSLSFFSSRRICLELADFSLTLASESTAKFCRIVLDGLWN